MSSADKRRRHRVQGGWAAPANQGKADTDKIKSYPGSEEQAKGAPHWLAKKVDNPDQKPCRYVYEETNQITKVIPKPRLILEPGVYDISDGPSGVSRLRLFYNFFDKSQSTEIFTELLEEVPWKQNSDVRQGVKYLQPRLTSWYGDIPYSYSGLTHKPNPQWLDVLKRVKTTLEENTGLIFNSMLANLYRDGHDSVDWHSDNEPALGPQPTIASVSFGDTRNFELRKNPPLGKEEEAPYMESIRMPLPAGSLLIMEGATQDDWKHRVPKEYHDRTSRVNLTFRVIYPT